MRTLTILALSLGLALLVGCRTEPATIPATALPLPHAPVPTALAAASQEVVVVQRLVLRNNGPGRPARQNLWVALIKDDAPYQQVLTRRIAPADYQIVYDEYGNQYAEFDFSEMPAGSKITIELRYELLLQAQRLDLVECRGPLPSIETQAELHIESRNPQIKALAQELAAEQATVCAKVRAFYDYIGDTLIYAYNGRSWGAQAALGEMGADCTEFSSLLIALSRATGIPARYVEGLVYLTGAEARLARTEHAWAEVYLPGVGWAPLDPTLGRTAFSREAYFAQMPANHIVVTRGRNPSTLRGASYWTHLYWPGNSTKIVVEDMGWVVESKMGG